MHDGSGRILVQNLSKNFGPVNAVRDLSFAVEPGVVTGFLGPNGSGKTTTLRMALGLVSPSAGAVTINGVPFRQLRNPATVVGAVLEAQSFHPTRTARNHLRCYAAAMNVPDTQVDHALELVGLTGAAHRGAGGFSLGMRQRLALATALLGDPQVLILDEPANGLDPEGIAWLRSFLRSFAASGRTVLVSSHLLREMEHTVDHVVIVSQGECVYNGHLDDLRAEQRSRVLVQASDPAALVTALHEDGLDVETLPDGQLGVTGSDAKSIADRALQAGVAIYGMQDENVDLEQLFFRLTSGQYVAGSPQQDAGPSQQDTGPYQQDTAEAPASGWGPPGGTGSHQQQESQQQDAGQDEPGQRGGLGGGA